MNSNSTTHRVALGFANIASEDTEGIGLQSRPSRNIRLSAVLCTMGFHLKIEAEPATIVIDFDTKQPVVTFWHQPLLNPDSPILTTLPRLTAYMVEMWWGQPAKYSIEGYDDALHAMRRVFESREWLILAIKGRVAVPGDARRHRGSVATESLHIASIIRASGVPLLAFDKGTFVFSKQAAPIAALIEASENSERSTRKENQAAAANSAKPAQDPSGPPDACVDWMLWALKYRDWLKRIINHLMTGQARSADGQVCAPAIEKRIGERVCRVSSAMPRTLRREFTRRF